MFSDAFMQYHDLNVGKRYVFFQSLQGKKLPQYQAAYSQGMQYVGQAAAQLNPSNIDKDETGLQTMLSYIQMIGDMAAQERANEIEFVNNFKNILTQDKLKILPKVFEEYLTNLNDNFSYPKLISLINTLVTDNSDFQKRREEIVKNNLELIQQNYTAASEKTQQEIQEVHETNYGKYVGKVNKILLRNILDDGNNVVKQFQTQATTIMANKFNSIMYNITSNAELVQVIKDSWTGSWTSSEIKKTIAGIALTYLLELDFDTLAHTSGEQMANIIVNNFNEYAANLDTQLAEQAFRVITGKSIKTLEEAALATRAGLGKLFFDLAQSAQSDVLKEYHQYGFSRTLEEINTLYAQNDRKAKALLTRELGAAIRKKAETTFGHDFSVRGTKVSDQQKKLVQTLKQQHPEFFQKRELAETLENLLNVQISGPSAAEFITSAQFVKAIKGHVFTPGSSLLLKTDASVTFTYNPITFKESETDLEEEIMPMLDNWQENFLQQYKIAGKGATDVQAAANVYEEMLKNVHDMVKEQLNKMGEDSKELTRILNQLQNYVNVSISAKEYNLGSNEFGFQGGSLGPNGEQALNNIITMYELGGISNIDVETLYFVLINCGPDAIASGLKQSLENFLLGGAAMMMFDDGFATANDYIQRMTQAYGFMPKTLHLYVVQGKYIPSSYIYTSIYNALLAAYQDISQTFHQAVDTGNGRSNVTIINNISDSFTWDYTTAPYNYAQNRFNTVSAQASGMVDIRFNFLAGILDVFNSIPQAFNV